MPTLSEAYASHPVHLRHHHLDFTAYRELPDTHAWPRHDDHPRANEPVPVVDLLDDPGTVLQQIAGAAESWGVFQVTNHGVPPRLLGIAENECRRLFSLPSEQKLKALRQPDGISGYGLARISTFFSKLMWSEGFTILGSPVDHARKLWPQDYHRFCEVIEEYNEHMKKLAIRLMGLMLASLGPPDRDDGEVWPGHEPASSVLQLNSYPACPDPDRAMGLAAHTDSSLLTLLHQSSTRGLQVLRPRDDQAGPARWVTVPPLPGALVVHVGDLFHILSNGRYQSVLHRAVVNRTSHRLSMAYIYGPPAHVKISPLKRLLSPCRGPAYPPVTWPEYLGLKAKHFDKALNLLRVQQEET